MKILIFGADTPLGKRLEFYLTGWAEEQHKDVSVIPNIDRPLDIEDIQKAVWQSYVGAGEVGSIDLIINAYGDATVAGCEYNKEQAFTDNSMTAAHIALAARSRQVPFVQLSTDMVFSGGPAEPSHEPSPLNTLGMSKYYGEQATQTIYPPHTNGNYRGTTILRTSTLYGFDVETPANNVVNNGSTWVDKNKTSLSFIGEVAFLIARNIIDSPQLLSERFIHIASDDPPIGWDGLFKHVGITASRTIRNSRIAMPYTGGLVPTPGWYLSSGHTKQWEDFTREQQLGRYLVYW